MELINTCRKGTVKDVKAVLQKQQNINFQDEEGNTALHITSYQNELMKSKELMIKGADVNIKNKYGFTPLLISENVKIIKLLLDYGADINVEDNKGENCLFLDDDDPDILNFLTSKGADVNHKNKNKWTPLHHACYYGHTTNVGILLNCCAKVNTFDEDDNTPLHFSCSDSDWNYVRITDLLLSRGADVYKNKIGKTPYDLAAKNYKSWRNSCLIDEFIWKRKKEITKLFQEKKCGIVVIGKILTYLDYETDNNEIDNNEINNMRIALNFIQDTEDTKDTENFKSALEDVR
jgi:ankyrin repeat protein